MFSKSLDLSSLSPMKVVRALSPVLQSGLVIVHRCKSTLATATAAAAAATAAAAAAADMNVLIAIAAIVTSAIERGS